MVDFVGMAVIGICVLITCCCLLCGRPSGDSQPKIVNQGKICSLVIPIIQTNLYYFNQRNFAA